MAIENPGDPMAPTKNLVILAGNAALVEFTCSLLNQRKHGKFRTRYEEVLKDIESDYSSEEIKLFEDVDLIAANLRHANMNGVRATCESKLPAYFPGWKPGPPVGFKIELDSSKMQKISNTKGTDGFEALLDLQLRGYLSQMDLFFKKAFDMAIKKLNEG